MFTLTLDTDNSAFDENVHAEVARILRDVADKMEAGRFIRSLHDVNGNAVGRIEWFVSVCR